MGNVKITILGSSSLKITCSMDTPCKIYPDCQLVGANSYENALNLLLSRKSDYAFVYAVHLKNQQRKFENLYHHPTTLPLLKKVKPSFKQLQNALNTEEAKAKLLSSVNNSTAITNNLVAKNFRIPIRQTLSAVAAMEWSFLSLITTYLQEFDYECCH